MAQIGLQERFPVGSRCVKGVHFVVGIGMGICVCACGVGKMDSCGAWRVQDDIQKLTDANVKTVEELCAAKEKELNKV